MVVHPQIHMSKEEFLRWIERQEGHFEYDRGRVVMQPGVTRHHARVSNNISRMLNARLDPEQFDIASAEFGVDMGETIRYPDFVVEPFSEDGEGRRALAPIFIIEILSGSTMALDFTRKREEYFSLPTVQSYLLASQSAAEVWLYARGPGGVPAAEALFFEGLSADVTIPGLGITLPLAEIYRGVVR